MRIRVKKLNEYGVNRIDSISKIDSIELKEDLVDPDKATIFVYFRGPASSGILNLTKNEALSLANSLKPAIKIMENTKNKTKKSRVKRTRKLPK